MADVKRVVLAPEVVPLHYDLVITPKIGGDFIFDGSVSITFDIKTDALSTLILHSKELTLKHASYVSKNTKLESTKFDYDVKLTTCSIDFGKSKIPKGEGVLTLEYTGLHNNQMAGFYRSGYSALDGSKKTMVSTQFEPLDARRCFPCVDEPAAKASFSCTLIVDEGLDALSNMPVEAEEKVEVNGVAKKRLKYEITPKMSTYLLAFCVGEFDYVEAKTKNDVLLRVYTPPGKKDMGKFAVDCGAKCLDIYDTMFGEPFPLPKMDMIAIPEFAMGAMENWGLITYREVDILIDEKKASSQQKQRVATVVAHELAHQWFGNLVTMEWWDNLWLNEGFASWMQNHATDKIYPEWSLWEQFIVEQQATALSLDALTSSHPIQVPIAHAEEVEQVFDAISYRKGASVVRMIHAFLGSAKFNEGLQKYMQTYKYGNTETHHLWNAWEEVSGKPVSKVMDCWTTQMGFPVINVHDIKVKAGKFELKLEQTWFLSDGSTPKESETKLWSIPMFALTEKGKVELPLFSGRTTTVTVNGSDWIKLNAHQHVPLRVNYPEKMWLKLREVVKAKKLPVTDRTGIILDALALTRAGSLSPLVLQKLLSAYENEDAYPVWDALGSALSSLEGVVTGDLKVKFQHFASKIVLGGLRKVGWEEKATDGHLGKLLRSLLIGLAAKFCYDDAGVKAESWKRYEGYLKCWDSEESAKILPSEFRSPVLRIVLKTATDNKPYEALMQIVEKLETTVEKKDIYLSIGSVNDMDKKREVLNWAASGAIKLQDFFYPIASVSISGDEGSDLCWEYFQENREKFVNMVASASPSLLAAVVTYSASGFCTYEKANEVEAYFKDHPIEKIDRKVAQIVEATRSKAKFHQILVDTVGFLA